MAKRTNTAPSAKRSRQGAPRKRSKASQTTMRRGGAMGDFAEELGTFMGTAERRTTEWLAQRKNVTDQLTAIRDRASQLLSQLGGTASKPATPARRSGKSATRKRTTKKTTTRTRSGR